MYQFVQRTLNLKHHVPFGECLFLTTSLENWDLKKAIRMQWTEQDVWICKINVPRKTDYFEYKYIVAGFEDVNLGTLWEKGPNRLYHTSKAKKVDIWEERQLNFFLKCPFDLESHQFFKVYLTGNWKHLDVPRQMKPKLHKDRTILHKYIQVNCSELETTLQYRYYILLQEKSSEEFREFLSEQKEFHYRNSEQLFVWDSDFRVNQIFNKPIQA